MRSSCSGFTYVGVLIAVAIMGTMLAAVATIWHQAQQRGQEQQLLLIGAQFRQAIGAYYENSPGPAKQFPKRLEDLLEDNRVPYIRRFLRKIFHDPVTGSTEWGLVKSPDGGIVGVYSKSDIKPLKLANFGRTYPQFEGKKQYSDWRFVYAGDVPMDAPIVAQNAGGIPALAPAEVIPPEYVPPPPQPQKTNSDDESKVLRCYSMHANDLQTCLKLSKKYDGEAGTNCLASAAKRYDSCINGKILPPLAVKYD